MLGWEAGSRLPVGARFHLFALLPGPGCHRSMCRAAALMRINQSVHCVDAAGYGEYAAALAVWEYVAHTHGSFCKPDMPRCPGSGRSMNVHAPLPGCAMVRVARSCFQWQGSAGWDGAAHRRPTECALRCMAHCDRSPLQDHAASPLACCLASFGNRSCLGVPGWWVRCSSRPDCPSRLGCCQGTPSFVRLPRRKPPAKHQLPCPQPPGCELPNWHSRTGSGDRQSCFTLSGAAWR